MVVTRTLDAPRERVWQAWRDPNQVMKWWGTAGLHVADVPDGLP